MSKTFDEVINEALSLPAGSRAMLAEHLLESLDAPDQNEIDAAWAVEAQRRVNEIQQGTAELIPGEKVFADLRSRTK